MSQNVIHLHGRPAPVAHYLRLGTLHRQIETLLGSGRMPLDRVVVEASAFSRQRDVNRSVCLEEAVIACPRL